MNTRMYVMTHKKIAELPDDIYQPLHVGKAGGESLGYAGDDTGDNISAKNPYYCELTGMYWLWKNINCEVIGICHYRRFFLRDGSLLNKETIERLIGQYPIIIPNSRCVKDANVYQHYAKRHYAKDLDLCREVIEKKYPVYVAAFDYAMDTILVSTGNMWITRKDIYDRYCQWLFDILFEVEKHLDMTGYDSYQQRVMGFLSERLFRVWLMMQPEPITEENVDMMEIEDFFKPQKKKELMLQLLQLKITPVINLHKGKTGTLVEPFECQDDFGGKIPVWFCFLQECMPETVKFCLNNIKSNLLESKETLRFITLENCMNYVSFTPAVIEKFNNGILDTEQLTELLHAELLYRYGGIWVDADIYVPSSVLHKMPGISAGQPYLLFLLESLWYYYEISDDSIQGEISKYILMLAEQEFPWYQQEKRSDTFLMDGVSDGDSIFERVYMPECYEKLKTSTTCWKMDMQKSYARANILGLRTLYGYINSDISS